MASYIKGNPVANATSYELFEKTGNTYTSLKTASEINFNLDELSLSGGSHTLVVKAKADGYEDSDYSNEVVYKVDEVIINYFNIDSDEIIWGKAPAAGSTEPVTTENRGTSHYIAVSPGDKVYGGYYSPSTGKATYYKNSPVYLYDSNKTYKAAIGSWTDADGKTDNTPRWITIPDGVAYMRCMLRNDPAPDNYKRDYQMITINQVLPDEFVPYNAN